LIHEDLGGIHTRLHRNDDATILSIKEYYLIEVQKSDRQYTNKHKLYYFMKIRLYLMQRVHLEI
jgi:hypothetical protein